MNDQDDIPSIIFIFSSSVVLSSFKITSSAKQSESSVIPLDHNFRSLKEKDISFKPYVTCFKG